MDDFSKYPLELRSLPPEVGGGFLISFPDFSEFIADGDTIEETMAGGQKALTDVIAALEEKGLPVPKPGSHGAYSGEFVRRLPISLYACLQSRAQFIGVSINTLATTYIAKGLSRKTFGWMILPVIADPEVWLLTSCWI